MVAAGAAEAGGDVAAGFRAQPWQPVVEEGLDLGDVGGNVRLRVEIGAYVVVAAGQRAQARFPVRVRQHPGVEHEIGVGGYAAAIGERLEQQRQASTGEAEFSQHAATHLVHVHLAGVNQHIGDPAQWSQCLPIQRDGIGQGQPEVTERMPTAGVGVAAQQDVIARFQEQQTWAHAQRADLRQRDRHVGQIAEIACIDADRDLRRR